MLNGFTHSGHCHMSFLWRHFDCFTDRSLFFQTFENVIVVRNRGIILFHRTMVLSLVLM